MNEYADDVTLDLELLLSLSYISAINKSPTKIDIKG